jgi:hypothetical protein
MNPLTGDYSFIKKLRSQQANVNGGDKEANDEKMNFKRTLLN